MCPGPSLTEQHTSATFGQTGTSYFSAHSQVWFDNFESVFRARLQQLEGGDAALILWHSHFERGSRSSSFCTVFSFQEAEHSAADEGRSSRTDTSQVERLTRAPIAFASAEMGAALLSRNASTLSWAIISHLTCRDQEPWSIMRSS